MYGDPDRPDLRARSLRPASGKSGGKSSTGEPEEDGASHGLRPQTDHIVGDRIMKSGASIRATSASNSSGVM